MFGWINKGIVMVIRGLTSFLDHNITLQGDLHIEDPLVNVIFKSVTLKTVHGRRIFRDWEQSEKLLHENRCIVMPL